MPLPSAHDNQVAYGGLGYVYIEERLETGAALGTPDTPHNIGKVGPVKISRKSSTSSTKVVYKTNSGEEVEARRGYTPTTSTTAPEIIVTFNIGESSADHLDFYATVKGKYYILTVPFGVRYTTTTSKKVEYYIFGYFEDGGDINLDGDKVSEIPVTFNSKTNTVAATTAVNADANLSATTATILINAGYIVKSA